MRAKFNLYNVYDLSGNKILANVMAKEVCSFTGLPANSKLSYYCNQNVPIKGNTGSRYRVMWLKSRQGRENLQRKISAQSLHHPCWQSGAG